jgi:hypothetical protein
VTTAVQAATSVLDDALASALPGTSFSLGNLLNSLSGGLLDQLTQALPKNLMKSFTNMTTLMQSIEASTGGSFSLAAKCDPEVFLTNAVGLLSQATNLSDLISAMQQLQTDTSLYGLENLGNTVVDVQTAFGKVKQSVDAFGNIIGYIPPDVASAAQTFTSALTSATSFPGVNIGQNLFGQSAAIIGDMINRLPPDNMKNAVSMLDKLNTSGDAKKIFNFVKATVEGDGNPFNFFT